MGKKKKSGKSAAVATSDAGALKTNPFGALAGLSAPAADAGSPPPAKNDEGGAEAPGQSSSASGPEAPAAPETPTRVVLSYQRKGRGGKEVTLVELRGVAEGELGPWLSRIKKALGCGGFVEGSRLAVTGDQRQRLRALFESVGVERVTVG